MAVVGIFRKLLDMLIKTSIDLFFIQLIKLQSICISLYTLWPPTIPHLKFHRQRRRAQYYD